MSASVLIASLAVPSIAVAHLSISVSQLCEHEGSYCMTYSRCCKMRFWPTRFLEFCWYFQGGLQTGQQPLQMSEVWNDCQTHILVSMGKQSRFQPCNEHARLWCNKCRHCSSFALWTVHAVQTYHEKPWCDWKTTNKFSKYSVTALNLEFYCFHVLEINMLCRYTLELTSRNPSLPWRDGGAEWTQLMPKTYHYAQHTH